jgi:hypothetical protein
MTSLTSFNPKKLIRGIFRRHKSEKGGNRGVLSENGGSGHVQLKPARSCPFVHVQSEDGQRNFESRLSLWTDAETSGE